MRGYIAGEMGWYLMKRFLCYVKKFKLYLIYKTRPVKIVRQGRHNHIGLDEVILVGK